MRCRGYVLGQLFIPVLTALDFHPNAGQASSDVRYLVSGYSETITIGDRSIGGLEFLGATPGQGTWREYEPSGHTVRYCGGTNERRHLCEKGVPSFRRLVRENLYAGIDWVIYSNGWKLEYDLVVHPGADLSAVRVRAPRESRLVDGELHFGRMIQRRTESYQVRNGVRLRRDVELSDSENGEYTFAARGVEQALDLVVDPIIEPDSPSAEGIRGAAGDFRAGIIRTLKGDTDVWIRFQSFYGEVTLYWGGAGDEEVGGITFAGDEALVAGWTTSRELPGYNGGASDGFVLRLRSQEIASATLMGGPGTDRLYSSCYSGGNLVIAGASDDSRWPSARVLRRGPGGMMDAIVGTWNDGAPVLQFLGGTGDDLTRQVIPDGKGSWFAAGEMDSPAFAEMGEGWFWAARFGGGVSGAGWVRRWPTYARGDRIAGLALIPGYGLYIGGTTTSESVEFSQNRYWGGESDGFVMRVEPEQGAVLRRIYVGGDGKDEIDTLTVRGSTVYLGGATSSKAVAFRGMPDGDSSLGGVDGWMAVLDHRLAPVWSYRAGGAGDDRILGVTPKATGVVSIAGAGDGVNATVRFADVEFSNPEMLVGAGLQFGMQIDRSAGGDDGLTLVESSDPSRLAVSNDRRVLGGARIAVLAHPDNEDRTFYVQATGTEPANGFEIALSGRDPLSAQRRLYVGIARSFYFLSALDDIVIAPGRTAPVTIISAPEQHLGGPAGQPQSSIPGRDLRPAITSSDPTAVDVTRGTRFTETEPGVFRGSISMMREGTYRISPGGVGLFPGYAQTVVVTSNAASPAPRYQLSRYFQIPLPVPPLTRPGDVLVFDCGRPCAVKFRSGLGFPVDQLRVTFPDPSASLVSVYADTESGEGNVTVSGIVSGAEYARTFRFRTLPALTEVLVDHRTKLGAGDSLYWRFRIAATSTVELAQAGYQAPPNPVFAPVGNTVILGVDIGSTAIIDVAQRTGNAQEAVYQLTAKAPGVTTVELAGQRRRITVVPAAITLPAAGVFVPAGEQTNLPYENFLTPTQAQRVRFRLADATAFRLVGRLDQGGDITVNLTEPYGVLIVSTGPIGSRTTLYVSAPGVAETSVPVTAAGVTIVPTSDTITVRLRRPSGTELQGYGVLRLRTFLDVPGGLELFGSGAMAQLSAEPPDICRLPSEKLTYAKLNYLEFNCNREGIVTLRVEPEGRSAFTIKIAVELDPSAAPRRPLEASPIRVGNGLQSAVSTYNGLGRFTGTITSADPSRVRLSVHASIAGVEKVDVTGSTDRIFVQGFGSEGVVNLIAVEGNGKSWEIPVDLFPSTFAIRADSSKSSLATWDFRGRQRSLLIAPAIVEPSTGTVFLDTFRYSVRGGTDPFFLQVTSSETAVAELGSASILVQEGDRTATISVQLRGTGESMLVAAAPASSVQAAGAGLRVRVTSMPLEFAGTLVLSPGLQTSGFLQSYERDMNATIRSLNPAKLMLAGSLSGPAAASLNVNDTVQNSFYLRTAAGAAAGELIGVEISAPFFETKRVELEVKAAELFTEPDDRAISVSPENANSASFNVYLSPNRRFWSGAPNPDSPLRLELRSTDPTVLEVRESSVTMAGESYATVPIRSLRPGKAAIRISAPPQIVNRAAEVAVEVLPWTIRAFVSETAARFLSSALRVQNPRNQVSEITIRSTGSNPALLGRTPGGADGPQSTNLVVRLAANSEADVYFEPTGSSGRVQLTLSAADSSDRVLEPTIAEPDICMEPQSISANLANGTSSLTLLMGALGSLPFRTLPVGNSAGGIRVPIRSSNPQVVRPVVDTVVIRPGESRQAVVVQLVGRGDAVLTIDLPAGVGSSIRQKSITVQVR